MAKDLFDWVKEKSSLIRQDAKILSKIDASVFGTSRPLSILKLISLGYIVPMYTSIIGNSNFFDNMIYIDLFSGSGINYIEHEGENHSFIGSPLVSVNAAVKPWNKMIFIDSNIENTMALQNRLKAKSKQNGFEWLKNAYQVYHGDVNEIVDHIIPIINKPKTHSFIFVDPFSMEIQWDTLAKIANQSRSDIFINIMAHEIHRAERSISGDSKKLDTWYGSKNWKLLTSRKEVANGYSTRLANIPDKNNAVREINELIPINAKEKIKDDPYYYLFFAARKTKGGSKWIDAVRLVKAQMKVADDNLVKSVLDIILFGQKSLFDNGF